jgi:hypothetical protein
LKAYVAFSIFSIFSTDEQRLDTKVFLLEGLCLEILEGLGLGCFNVVFIVGTVTVRVIGKITLFPAWAAFQPQAFSW